MLESLKKTNAQIYQHYRTRQLYQLICIAIHEETHEEMVIYQALYNCEKYGNNQIWVRPKNIFFEMVEDNGVVMPRFKLVENDLLKHLLMPDQSRLTL